MGWLAEMTYRIAKVVSTKSKATDIEKIATQLAELRLEQTGKAIEIDQLEAALKAAQLAAFDGGDEEGVELARDALLVARNEAADLASLVAGLEERHQRAKHNFEAAARAKQLAEVNDGLLAARDAVQRITAAGELMAKAGRDFFSAYDRAISALPDDMKLDYVPSIFRHFDVHVKCHVGSRGPLLRDDAKRYGQNLDALATMNVPLKLIDELISTISPDGPSSGTARAA